jgi:curved DNA-binding protein CbpA
VTGDPFAVLGLPARAGLTDEDVRAAWRRIAAATHPDREDGGDPDRFGPAAAAYVTLRTSFGRGEALADLTEAGPGHRARRPQRRGAHRAGPGRGQGQDSGRAAPDRPAHRAAHAKGTWPGSGYGRLAGVLGSRGLGLSRGLAVPVLSADAAAVAAAAATGITPASIGLLTGALTVTGWALWRRGGLDR